MNAARTAAQESFQTQPVRRWLSYGHNIVSSDGWMAVFSLGLYLALRWDERLRGLSVILLASSAVSLTSHLATRLASRFLRVKVWLDIVKRSHSVGRYELLFGPRSMLLCMYPPAFFVPLLPVGVFSVLYVVTVFMRLSIRAVRADISSGRGLGDVAPLSFWEKLLLYVPVYASTGDMFSSAERRHRRATERRHRRATGEVARPAEVVVRPDEVRIHQEVNVYEDRYETQYADSEEPSERRQVIQQLLIVLSCYGLGFRIYDVLNCGFRFILVLCLMALGAPILILVLLALLITLVAILCVLLVFVTGNQVTLCFVVLYEIVSTVRGANLGGDWRIERGVGISFVIPLLLFVNEKLFDGLLKGFLALRNREEDHEGRIKWSCLLHSIPVDGSLGGLNVFSTDETIDEPETPDGRRSLFYSISNDGPHANELRLRFFNVFVKGNDSSDAPTELDVEEHGEHRVVDGYFREYF